MKLTTQQFIVKLNNNKYKTDDEFLNDLKIVAVNEGIPKEYAGKAIEIAQREGHEYGYYEIYNQLLTLSEIFEK